MPSSTRKLKFSPYRSKSVKRSHRRSPLKGRRSPIKGRTDARMSTLTHRIKRISAKRSGRKSSRKSMTKTEVRKTVPGASNLGKYKKSEGPFCGTTPGTFPVGSPARVKAALSYRRDDPRPNKVKKCACRRAKALGINSPVCNIHGRVSHKKRSSKKY